MTIRHLMHRVNPVLLVVLTERLGQCDSGDVSNRDRWRLGVFGALLLVGLVVTQVSAVAEFVVLGLCVGFPVYVMAANCRENRRQH